jgi:hypothetical protein
MDYIIIFIVAVLVIVQFFVFSRTNKLLSRISNMFPIPEAIDLIQTYVQDEDENELAVAQLEFEDSRTKYDLFKTIKDTINSYLLKNKGAVSDFMLIKDIVERHCDSEEEAISVQIPIPLYIGLMGTMVGIIFGIGGIALGDGGFAAFVENPQDSIGDLMSGVAIAMLASLCGIVLTTISSWMSKTTKTKLEADKNAFYSWVQVNLLPALGGNMTNTLQMLQQNLTSFNLTFSSNVSRMETALGNMSKTFGEQSQILEQLNKLDVHKMAQANVTILRQLDSSMGKLQQFSSYLSQTTEYLNAVKQLSQQVGDYVSRTGTLESLAEYFDDERNFFEERRLEINKGVVTVDDTIKKSFQALQENGEQTVQNVSQYLVKQQSALDKLVAEVDAKNNSFIEEQQRKMEERLKIHVQAFESKVRNLDSVAGAIKDFAAVKNSLSDLNEFMRGSLFSTIQKQLEKVSLNMSDLASSVSVSSGGGSNGMSKGDSDLLRQQRDLLQRLCETVSAEQGKGSRTPIIKYVIWGLVATIAFVLATVISVVLVFVMLDN